MTRLARMVVSGLPHHVTQHGNRRESIFFEDAIRRFTAIMKYDYGQRVFYKPSSKPNVVTMPCSVVAITTVDNSRQAEVFGYPQGTVVYTVEFGDGSDKTVSEDELSSI
jgi:hypothetical protein